MSEYCPHCGSTLKPYWWETQVPQNKWTAQQQQDSAARQLASLQYHQLIQRVTDNTGEGR